MNNKRSLVNPYSFVILDFGGGASMNLICIHGVFRVAVGFGLLLPKHVYA